MRIAVLGGGNGSFAAAGDMALAGHEVRLWRRDAQAVKQHNAAGGIITVKDFRGQHEARPALITADIGEAARDAELILCPAPATAAPSRRHSRTAWPASAMSPAAANEPLPPPRTAMRISDRAPAA